MTEYDEPLRYPRSPLGSNPDAAPSEATPSGTPAPRPHDRVLICDDEELIRWSLSEHLRAEGFEVAIAKNGEECLREATSHAPDAILLDLKMPVMDGLTCLRRLRETGLGVPVVVLTAHGAVDSAIEATRLGAHAYLSKPFDLREITLKLRKAIETDRLSEEVRYLRDQRRARYGNIVGQSPSMRAVFDTMRKLEGIDGPTVLVTGESGTGKELVAQAIHEMGPRKDHPFVEIDCASIPENLMESEIFGHERGAFTDAKTLKRGLFEVARGGTIFLDEIGEMSLAMQAKLLRAIETRRFRRVGGVVDLPVDAGVVAATNRDLGKEVEKGTFRRDLYYRLAVIPLTLPPLRERPGDIPLLVDHILESLKKRIPGNLSGIDPQALSALSNYNWPGNVRELRNVLERVVTLYRDVPKLELQHLPVEVRYATDRSKDGMPGGGWHGGFVLPPQGVDLDAVERHLVVQAMDRTKNNQTAAAKLLGISRYALRHRLQKFGLRDEG
ncbi:MAG: sigma-54-dependent Fis family transcriptional regulator [Deltaproteobacteria bacterium]|nr:sigma-54-dependent Fis family transcriptional regulator [Deltaproteobacteria bacterium]